MTDSELRRMKFTEMAIFRHRRDRDHAEMARIAATLTPEQRDALRQRLIDEGFADYAESL